MSVFGATLALAGISEQQRATCDSLFNHPERCGVCRTTVDNRFESWLRFEQKLQRAEVMNVRSVEMTIPHCVAVVERAAALGIELLRPAR